MVKTKTNKTSTKIELNVEPRTIIGKKVKRLREKGYIPATVYGPDFKSQSIQVPTKDFLKVYKTAHETGIVLLKLDKEQIPTLIKNLQRHPIDSFILHADFRKIDLKQKMETAVPVKMIGESEAVVQKGGVLLTQAESIMVEALPEDIPQSIDIDISILKDIGQEIKVSDLAKSSKYEVKDAGDKVIVSVIAHKEESITPEVAAPVTEVITEKKPEEGEAVTEEKETKAEKAPAKKEEKK